jgi:hypothetical protein
MDTLDFTGPATQPLQQYDSSLEQKARRVAKKAGFVAKKSRDRVQHGNNKGGFQIIEPYRNEVVAGGRLRSDAAAGDRFLRKTSGDVSKIKPCKTRLQRKIIR